MFNGRATTSNKQQATTKQNFVVKCFSPRAVIFREGLLVARKSVVQYSERSTVQYEEENPLFLLGKTKGRWKQTMPVSYLHGHFVKQTGIEP